MEKEKKYVGVTLIFACRKNKILQAEKISFLIEAGTSRDIQRKAAKIGCKREIEQKRERYEYYKYLGIHDIFEVNGPIENGAIMGRTTLWSYKNITAAKKLLHPKREFTIYKCKWPTVDRRYIAEIVYFLGPPEKYALRRTLICHVLIQSQDKNRVIRAAMHVGKSKELILKVKQILLQYESEIPGELKFIGPADVWPIYEKVMIGNPFRAVYKKFNKISSIRKLVSSKTEIVDVVHRAPS